MLRMRGCIAAQRAHQWTPRLGLGCKVCVFVIQAGFKCHTTGTRYIYALDVGMGVRQCV